MSLYECDRPDCTWKNTSWRYGFADAGMSHAMHMDDHQRRDDELAATDEPNDSCDDCTTNTECVACLGDRIYSAERDARLEDTE